MIVSMIGKPGTGKSTLANDLVSRTDLMTRVRGDHYAKSKSQEQTFQEYFRECRIDWDLMDSHMDNEIGEFIETPVFDYSTMTRVSETGDKGFDIKPIFLIDQVYAHPRSDLVILMTLPEHTRKIRSFFRNIKQGRGIQIFNKNKVKNDLDPLVDFHQNIDIELSSTNSREENVQEALKLIMTAYETFTTSEQQ